MPTSQQSLKVETSKSPSKLKRIIVGGLTATTIILAYVVGGKDITISDVIQTIVNVVSPW